MREDRGDVGLGERPELQPGDVRPPCQARHDLAEQGRTAGLGVPVGGDYQQPHGDVESQHVTQQQQREVVGPVQVVQHDQHGRRCAGGLKQRAGGLEHTQPLDLRLCGSRLGNAAGQASRELGHQPNQVARTRTQLDPQLGADWAGRDVGAKRLRERLSRRGQAVVAAPVQHHALPRASVPGELSRQPRLADARLAADQDATAASRDSIRPRRPQRGEILLAARERGAAFEHKRRGERDRHGAPRGPAN